MRIEQKIEALLFYKGEPTSIQELSSSLSVSPEEVTAGLKKLSEELSDRGIRVVLLDDTAELRTAEEMGALIEGLRKQELSRDLGKAGSETLSIILYKGAVSRSQIDFIRGVNSTFILRNLLIRGLVERVTNPEDQRSYLYKPTVELLSHLGITRIEELPEYERVVAELETFETEHKEDVGS